jgi:hypothetical protein
MADPTDNVRSWVKSRHRFFVTIEWPLFAQSGQTPALKPEVQKHVAVLNTAFKASSLRQRRLGFLLFRGIDFNGRLDNLFPSRKNHDESNREEQHGGADRAR